jgi:hypothetical protein
MADVSKTTAADADYCSFIERARAALPERVTDAGALAGHYVSRESTDFLGRLDDAFSEVQNVFDDYPDGDVPLEAAHLAFEAFETIAALALAQLALLRAMYPTVGASPDNHGVEAA